MFYNCACHIGTFSDHECNTSKMLVTKKVIIILSKMLSFTGRQVCPHSNQKFCVRACYGTNKNRRLETLMWLYKDRQRLYELQDSDLAISDPFTGLIPKLQYYPKAMHIPFSGWYHHQDLVHIKNSTHLSKTSLPIRFIGVDKRVQ